MLGDTGEFRGNKGTAREGGLRIPFIIRWPGRVKAGAVDSENVIAGYDWLPSVCSLAGVKAVPDDLDGEDVSDIWLGATRRRENPLFWKAGGNHAMREGKWKYFLPWELSNCTVVIHGAPQPPPWIYQFRAETTDTLPKP